jgi:CubicO group peptidase (beta-lactamase class C family)
VPTMIRVLPVVALAMAGSATLARAQAEPGAPAPSAAGLGRVSEFFQHEVATGKIPGAVVLIQQHGLPIYLKCFGVRDVATRQPMTPDTIFSIHSMTKPITSVAAMMLIEEGKLVLADPVS